MHYYLNFITLLIALSNFANEYWDIRRKGINKTLALSDEYLEHALKQWRTRSRVYGVELVLEHVENELVQVERARAVALELLAERAHLCGALAQRPLAVHSA